MFSWAYLPIRQVRNILQLEPLPASR